MGWKAYRLVYQAKSPIHIGWHTLGYIKLTRYYVTGRNMWGAITASLTRSLGVPGTADYSKYGEKLKKDVLLSYFYPALEHNRENTKEYRLMLPLHTDNGLMYGAFSKEEFERLFISSIGQTAILPENNTAEDETLHESEYIKPTVSLENEQKNVYFVGYIFFSNRQNDETLEYKQIEDTLGELFVGGDRKYGWGRLLLVKTVPVSNRMFEHEIVLNGGSLMVKIEKKYAIPSHLYLNSATSIKLKGDIEPLVGREWNNTGNKKSGAGQKISNNQLCWTPGSVISEENKKTLTFKIGKFGILTNQESQE